MIKIEINDNIKKEWIGKRALIIIKEIDASRQIKKLIFNGLILDIDRNLITFRVKYNNLKSYNLSKIDEIQEIKERGLDEYGSKWR